MGFKNLRLYKEEEGNGLVWFVLFFFVVIGMSGLVIDGGILYKTRSELRKAANAAVLSGAQEIKISDDSVRNVVNTVLTAHDEEGNLKELLIRPEGKDKVTVTLEQQVPLYFMKLFNFNSAPVSVTSSAAIAPISRTVGAVPFGIHKDTPLEYMQQYELKVDAGNGVYGNYGILALSGPGANLYEQDLKYGYDSELEIGDIIRTQTGNIEQPTIRGVNYRIDSSPYPDGDLTHRDDPRIIVILVYEPYEVATNQIQSVKVCGFAYFYLTEPMSHNDSSVKGYFIQRVGTGIGDVTAPNNGAFAIKLVE